MTRLARVDAADLRCSPLPRGAEGAPPGAPTKQLRTAADRTSTSMVYDLSASVAWVHAEQQVAGR
jgi:hypothetical protein